MIARKILLPLDGSELSETGLPVALALARRWQAELILARVVNPVMAGVGMGLGVPSVATALLERENAVAAAYLERQRELCEGVLVRTIKQVGSPWDSVAKIARDEQCDLVVMAPSGRSGISRWLLGSVAESTLRQAPCPILLVRPSAVLSAQAGFQKVLVPCDGSEASSSILASLDSYLGEGSKVTLLRASGLFSADYADVMDPQARAAFLGHLESDLRRHTLPGREVDYRVIDGDPADTILTEAEGSGFDLIAMSTHGYRGFDHLFMGSVAEKVARHAPCCLLAFRHISKGEARRVQEGETAPEVS